MSLTVHVVSHTHWDREWYLTHEQFRLRLVDLVDAVLARLEGDPGFTFHLDGQTVVLEDYLDVRPEQEERLRAQVSSGRLLVGPWYVMPDQFLVSGEALVRNLFRGHRVARRFGGAMRAGYIPDPFGHVAQMPQLLRGFGLDSAILWRGFDGPRAEYRWESPDGSRVLLLHLPEEGYCNALWLPLAPPEQMEERAAELLARERARTAAGQALLMAGVDHVEPHPRLGDVLGWLGRQDGVRGGLSTLPAYVDAVRAAAQGLALDVVRGELRGGEQYAFLLPGVLSTRVYLKQANARVQRELEHWTEPLAALGWLAGAPYPSGPLAHAWRTLLQNHPHDSICGCSVDAVHDENMTRFARAGQVAEELAARALARLGASAAAATGGAARVLAVNTDARPFSGVVELSLELPLEGGGGGRRVPPEHLDVPLPAVPADRPLSAVLDGAGRPIPFQVLADEPALLHLASRFEPPWAVRARRLRVAVSADVPAFAGAAFDLHFDGARTGDAPAHPVQVGERAMENGLLRVALDADGTFELHDLAAGRALGRCALLLDEGDVGDEYTHSPPARDGRIDSDGARVRGTRVVATGPLRGVLETTLDLEVPAEAAADRRSRAAARVALPIRLRVSLDAGGTRVGVTVEVENAARDHRLRLLFPLGAAEVRTARADSAFALVERPARRALPAEIRRETPVSAAPLLSFVDAGDGRAGLTVFADGLCEYEVLPDAHGWWLALTLLRCVGDLSREDLATRRGGAGPSLPTPGAQCPGRHVFRLAVAPRAAPPDPAALFAGARAFLSPPRAVAATGAPGAPASLAPRILADAGGLVLSACTKADDRDSLVLRAFNPGAREAAGRYGLPGGLEAAFRLDLLEQRLAPLPVEEGLALLSVRPHGIETFELVPRRVGFARREEVR
jgi:mannosylglycerate hydrolase